MTLNRSELKKEAKANLNGKFGSAIAVLFLIVLVLAVSGITFIGPILLGGPLAIGGGIFFLKIAQKKDTSVRDAFEGFGQFGSGFVAYILQAIFVILWSLLLIIPGIIAALSYSQTYFILAENKELGGLAAISKSKELMKGHKGELFVLQLSFFWWYLLVILTLGIALFYVGPYIASTLSAYYKKLTTGDSAVTAN